MAIAIFSGIPALSMFRTAVRRKSCGIFPAQTFTFDESKEYSNVAKEHYSDLKANRGWDHIFGSAVYDTSCFYPGLQAADMVAYEGRRRIERETVDTEVRPIRKLLLNLESKHQLTIAHHDRFSLESFKARWNAMKTQLMRRTGQ